MKWLVGISYWKILKLQNFPYFQSLVPSVLWKQCEWESEGEMF